MTAKAKLLIQTVRDIVVVNFEDTSILDTAHVEAVAQELYPLVDARACRKLILDFTKVKFLSSSALSILINLRNKSSAIKGTVVICGLRADLKKVFEITKLTKLFTFCGDENEALAVYGVTAGG